MTTKSDSNSLARATVAFLGQATRPLYFCVGARFDFLAVFPDLKIYIFVQLSGFGGTIAVRWNNKRNVSWGEI